MDEYLLSTFISCGERLGETWSQTQLVRCSSFPSANLVVIVGGGGIRSRSFYSMPNSPVRKLKLDHCNRTWTCGVDNGLGAILHRRISCLFQVASRWVRVSGPAAPRRLEGTRAPREEGEGVEGEIRTDPAVDSQQCLASPSTPSQHLLPVALFSPATSSVRVIGVSIVGVHVPTAHVVPTSFCRVGETTKLPLKAIVYLFASFCRSRTRREAAGDILVLTIDHPMALVLRRGGVVLV